MLSFLEILSLIIIGYFLRIILIGIYLCFLKIITKDKKKRKKVKLPKFNEGTIRFLGYVGILSTVYLGFVDFARNRPITSTELNSIIWFGMFLPNIILAISHHLIVKKEGI